MLSGMDDWHRRLAGELVKETPAGVLPESVASVEVGFGQARSALAYALELGRAHRIPITGSVAGDDLWLQLGDGRVRFTLNRGDGRLLATLPGQREPQPVPPGGADLGKMARDAIDAMVGSWRAARAYPKMPGGTDDEPTKG
jgi:hypothetical protein